MDLSQTINEALKLAMKEKDPIRLRALRAIKSALLLAQTEKAGAVVDAAKELQVLQKLAKQRRDSMAIYQAQNRLDLFKHEQEELDVIETFLPQAISPEELEIRIAEIIEQLGAKGMADLSKVMPKAIQVLNGQADNKAISDKVKALLSAQ